MVKSLENTHWHRLRQEFKLSSLWFCFFVSSFAAFLPQYQWCNWHTLNLPTGSYQDRSWRSHWLQNTLLGLHFPKPARQALLLAEEQNYQSPFPFWLSQNFHSQEGKNHTLCKRPRCSFDYVKYVSATIIVVIEVYNKSNHFLLVSPTELLMFFDK